MTGTQRGAGAELGVTEGRRCLEVGSSGGKGEMKPKGTTTGEAFSSSSSPPFFPSSSSGREAPVRLSLSLSPLRLSGRGGRFPSGAGLCRRACSPSLPYSAKSAPFFLKRAEGWGWEREGPLGLSRPGAAPLLSLSHARPRRAPLPPSPPLSRPAEGKEGRRARSSACYCQY